MKLPATLDALPVGRPATVARVLGAGAGAGADGVDLTARLQELGILPGEAVRVLHRAFPSGDPLAVRIGNSTFALRRHEAALVALDDPRACGVRRGAAPQGGAIRALGRPGGANDSPDPEPS